jgi:signal transduction histidine kinase
VETVSEHEITIEELRQRERRKDQYLAVIAHELRSPLAPIANAVEVLTINQEDDEIAVHAHAIVRRQLQHLGRLIEDLLDLGQIVHGAVGLRRQTMDLAQVITESVDTVRPLAEVSSHELTLNVADALVLVDADPARISQVLVNLLTNAIKYTEPGGQIEISLSRSEPWALIQVKDNGIGISPDELLIIFELFARAEGALRSGREGLGIGLALAHQIVERHGGSIEAHSEGHGRGSEFIVRLPLPPAALC